MNDDRRSMKRIDDPSWRYVPAAKSHVGFKQRLRRYAEMVKTEQLARDPDGSVLVSSDVAVGTDSFRHQVANASFLRKP